MASAAHIAACARQIGYPDMESVIMRVMATRPCNSRGARGRAGLVHHGRHDPLALLDPGAARIMLEQIEARSGLDPAMLPNTRDPWLTAWALVDLPKAEALFEIQLAALESTANPNLQSTGFFRMVEILATPPQRREAAQRDGPYAASWQPGH